MKYTTRMLLLPEDVYNELIATTKVSPPPIHNSNNNNLISGDLHLLGQSKDRIGKIERSKGGTIDGKEIKYSQEYKRYRKLAKDQLERPVNVRLVESLLNASLPATTTANPQHQQQQLSSPAAQKRRRGRPPKQQNQPEVFQTTPTEEGDTSADDANGDMNPSSNKKKNQYSLRKQNIADRKTSFFHPDRQQSSSAANTKQQQKGKGININKRPINYHKKQYNNILHNIKMEHFKPKLW
jgi:hypothetical protein